MRKKLYVEIGNFVCLFGEQELLESFDKRIWPVFRNNRKVPHKRGETLYYVFHNFKVKKIGNDEYLCGRIIKKMNLKSTQDYNAKKEEISYRSRSLNDAPSSIFLLRLYDHKLLVIKETSRAPSLRDVGYIMSVAFHKHFIETKRNERAKFLKRKKKKVLTKKIREEFSLKFNKEFPLIDFRITPITSYEKVEDVFHNFKQINKFALTLLHTNQEDPKFKHKLLKQLLESKTDIGGGQSGSVKADFSNKEIGINISEVEIVVKDLAKSGGNATFYANGTDEDDVELKVKDKDLTVKDSINVERILSEESLWIEGAKKIEVIIKKNVTAKMKNIDIYKELAQSIYKKLQSRKK